MKPAPAELPPVLNPAPPQTRTLRKLFLTIYLRGRSSRGLKLKTAPKSVWRKLAIALTVYTFFGLFAVGFLVNNQPLFALAIYTHSVTFIFLGMFVSSSAGEVLFNKDEADILMHRPISARDLLWSKIRVLIQISLWLAGALNLVALVVGYFMADGGVLFPFIHIVSTVLEALFCTGCVVLTYQLCLRWFGRERLDSLMTMTQVLIAVALVISGQILPKLMFRMSQSGLLQFNERHWWIAAIPPGWFAGMDDAVAAHGNGGSWLLAGIGLIATALVVWLAFGKLAENYGAGLQTIGESISPPKKRSGSQRRWTEIIASVPPLKWFSPGSRAGFILTVAYLVRDRDVKLRVFPGIAPMLMVPLIFLFQDREAIEGFGTAFSSGFLATIPLITLDLLQYSQQWQASDIFRVAPMSGPGELCHGARRAVLWLLTVPAFILIGFIIWVARHNVSHLLLLLPGLILIPIVSLIPAALRRGVPLSFPNEEIKSAGRSLKMAGVMMFAVIVSFVAAWAFKAGYFWWLILAELVIAVPGYFGLSAMISRLRWKSLE
jgi:ABC-2 type transport system permease protein